MPSLKEIIDYSKAPLVQWEPVVGHSPSDGKQKEDDIIYPRIAGQLNRAAAREITGIIADEARLEIYLSKNVPTLEKANHLTLKGAFEQAARKNTEHSPDVAVAVETEEIISNSQDAVVLNMILGCVAQPGYYQNIANLISLAASYLKEGGELIIVRPNPEGGAFDTYACLTAANDLAAGQSYDFVVKGLEDKGAMKNIHTPDAFLEAFLAEANFKMQKTHPLGADDRKNAPFLMNVATFKGPGQLKTEKIKGPA